ncbi:MAG: N-acetylmuramic acid 6-phosphate etherase [Candidatus Hydrogenedentota bacterium]
MNRYLAFEGGGTRTTAALFGLNGERLAEAEGGPSNPTSQGPEFAAAVLYGLGRQLLGEAAGSVSAVGAGLAGAARLSVRDQTADAVARAFPGSHVRVGGDLYPLLWANAGPRPAILVVAGTGSSVLVQTGAGSRFILGGWGPVFGDQGSAYGLATAGLQAMAEAIDGAGPPTALIEELPKAVGVSTPRDLCQWAAGASRAEIAALAPVVVAQAEANDGTAVACLHVQAWRLVSLVAMGRDRGRLPQEVPVFLHGGLFHNLPAYTQFFTGILGAQWPGCAVQHTSICGPDAVLESLRTEPAPAWMSVREPTRTDSSSVQLSPTEALAPAVPIDRLEPKAIAETMHEADRRAVDAVTPALPVVAEVMERAGEAIREGGRIIYMGAGTSGRLGVLDASECPPTFGVPPGRVVALMAGGERAVRESIEGSEDEEEQAVRDLDAVRPGAADMVIGIAASGTTPYVRAGLGRARACGASTALVCCNPAVREGADHIIAACTGPEVVAGSTRLKAGTATKLILNMISTGAMTRAGYVFEGRMVRMRPVNAKLRRRAVLIVRELAERPEAEAERLLNEAGNDIAVAVLMARKQIDAATARRRLEAHGYSLREALEET